MIILAHNFDDKIRDAETADYEPEVFGKLASGCSAPSAASVSRGQGRRPGRLGRPRPRAVSVTQSR